jgi:uncharacterized oligopeptide transporter (OPT) family protein
MSTIMTWFLIYLVVAAVIIAIGFLGDDTRGYGATGPLLQLMSIGLGITWPITVPVMIVSVVWKLFKDLTDPGLD